MKWPKIILPAAIVAIVVVAYFVFSGNDKIDYNTQVKPILNKKCITCHGGVKREADFSLLFRQEAMEKAESGKYPIVPGDPSSSELIRRINSHDPEVRMPYKKESLTPEEIEILTNWIDQGAAWGDHWAYQSVAEQKLPEVSSWAKNDIDRFIEQKLNDEDLSPSAEADKETLLRRVSLDVIGMPASETLQKEFLNSTDPNAYDVLVDSLLRSPRFGEKWTSAWLDLARYSDTKGYERDYVRSIWRYRDWVIQALNRGMPYDSFLIEQIAGDLLPHPTDAQYIATAFHRNTMTNDEGGTDNEEYRTAAILDRVNTTWESLMGTTFACVQCHSHPYDPFRHEEYYKFMAFFNNTSDEDTYEDYPVLRHFDKTSEEKLDGLRNWVSKEVSAEKANELYVFLKTWQPIIVSVKADEFVNSALEDTKWLTMRRHSSARLKQVTLNKHDKMIYRFNGLDPGGKLALRIDSDKGPVIANIDVPQTKGWTIEEVDLKPVDGVHDVYITYENPNLKIQRDTGLQFDWFYFTDSSIPWSKQSETYRKDYWELLTKKVDVTPVMVENGADMTRTSQVFERGSWLAKTDTVQADVPASLTQMPDGAPKNRLGLAMWLTSKQNPLVSRTIVNRIWEQIFGMGLVETLEDFGTQGIPPTHPELLDHLSWQLMNDYDWRLKSLVREIVTSNTYKQISTVTEEHLKKDRFNRFYARAPRVRLSAEQLRDQTLAVSGLLSTKMYGPGTMPHQPEGVWLSPYNGDTWKKSKGEDQYRRAVYTYWKRTAPYPSMMTFDGSAREVCMARRIRTNTPLQALVTLNDSAYVEAANALATRMIESDNDLKNQIKNGFSIAIGHTPTNEEIGIFVNLYNKIGKGTTFRKINSNNNGTQPNGPDKAMVMVASAILNLDEFITKN